MGANRKTVFVIGAGASHELDLPTGTGLKYKIKDALDINFDGGLLASGDENIYQALKHVAKNHDTVNLNDLRGAAIRISRNMSQAESIDNFIENHRSDQWIAFVAKLAIISTILEAERDSKLFFNEHEGIKAFSTLELKDTWLGPFFSLIIEHCDKNDLAERFESIGLIIFNYDRCVEHFLYNQLIHYYGINGAEARSLISKIEIIHPYGKVAPLNWESADTQVEFGEEIIHSGLLDYRNNIKTFTETTATSSSESDACRNLISNAKTLAFLGFAFHPINMRLLGPSELNPNPGLEIFATGFGLSQENRQEAEREIKGFYTKDHRMRFHNNECSTFFDNFRLSLSFLNRP